MKRSTNPDPRLVAGGRVAQAIIRHGHDSPEVRAAQAEVYVVRAELALRELANLPTDEGQIERLRRLIPAGVE